MKLFVFSCLFLAARLSFAAPSLRGVQTRDIAAGDSIEKEMGPGRVETFRLHLNKGESANIDVLQIGVDVIVDVLRPDGRLLDSIDGPTGRNGVEKVELIADSAGIYTLSVRPYDAREPVGKIRLAVRSVRDAASTRRLLGERKAARLQDASWLRRKSAVLALPSADGLAMDRSALTELVGDATVVGLGEATHGSREFNDARLAITKQLVRDFGFRVIALEFSAGRARELKTYSLGAPLPPMVLASQIDSHWIGGRIRRELYAWIRKWNRTHKRSDSVTIIGVDAGDDGMCRSRLFRFLRMAYGTAESDRWSAAEKELRDADEQTPVFGDTGVNAETRAALIEIQARLNADRPMLEKRFGAAAIVEAAEDAATLFEFADYNSGARLSKSRDWYMSMRVLRGLRSAGPAAHAVYWAHNAHIAATSSGFRTTGSLLREALGARYRPIAATCGTGSFVAQLPNDREDRLVVSSFLPHQSETIEDTLSLVRPGPFVSYWGRSASSPPRLDKPLPMHWIGGIYTPSSPVSTQYRPFRLLHDFDAIVYIPTVSAESMPSNRPIIPGRKRD